MIRVLVVGNVALFRGALAATLANENDLDVVGQVETACGLGTPRADVAIVDLDSAQPASCPAGLPDLVPTRTVVLTTEQAPRALRYPDTDRVHGVVDKDGGVEQLVRAVRRVAAGERVVEPARGTGGQPLGNTLTEREVEVLRLAAEGHSSARIAATLGLTVGTVRNYLSTIIRKTGVRNRLEAIRAAGQAGWL